MTLNARRSATQQPPPRRRPGASAPPGFVAAPAAPSEQDEPGLVEIDVDRLDAERSEPDVAALRREVEALRAEKAELARQLAERAGAPTRGRSARGLNELARRVRGLLRLRDQVAEITDEDELAAPGEADRRRAAAELFSVMAERGREIWQREVDGRERGGHPVKMIEPIGVTHADHGALVLVEAETP